MHAHLARLNAAFSAVHPRLRFAFVEGESGMTDVTVTELDDRGDLAGLVHEALDLARLEGDPRAAAWIEGMATRARARADLHASASDRTTWFTPSSVLPTILLDAEHLTTADDFAAAAGEGFSLLARLETLALCDALVGRMPEAIAAVRRDEDAELALVDAMFARFSDRFATGHTLASIRRIAEDDRRHLAPLLVAFLDETARDPDLSSNAWRQGGKPLTRPIAHDEALRVLVRWGVDVAAQVDGWARARVISEDAAAEARHAS